MFFHLPSTLAACVLASSAVRASFVSSSQDGGQVVLDSTPGLALPTYERPVDALGRETYDGYSVVRFDTETVEKRKELVRIGQVSPHTVGSGRGNGTGGRSEVTSVASLLRRPSSSHGPPSVFAVQT